MTFDQLYAIAERQGTVQWGRDGVIEHLRLSKDKKVIRARPIKQSKVHTIRRHKDVVSFNCIEVDSITKVPIKPTIFDLKAVAVPNGSPIAIGALPEIAPGVKAVVVEDTDGFYVPVISAENPGSGDVSRFLDALPRDVRIVFSTVLSPKLAEMLQRRGFQPVTLNTGNEEFDAFERLPEGT